MIKKRIFPMMKKYQDWIHKGLKKKVPCKRGQSRHGPAYSAQRRSWWRSEAIGARRRALRSRPHRSLRRRAASRRIWACAGMRRSRNTNPSSLRHRSRLSSSSCSNGQVPLGVEQNFSGSSCLLQYASERAKLLWTCGQRSQSSPGPRHRSPSTPFM